MTPGSLGPCVPWLDTSSSRSHSSGFYQNSWKATMFLSLVLPHGASQLAKGHQPWHMGVEKKGPEVNGTGQGQNPKCSEPEQLPMPQAPPASRGAHTPSRPQPRWLPRPWINLAKPLEGEHPLHPPATSPAG
jgi:hypothetical protein